MNNVLLTMYILCGIGLLVSAYLHGEEKPQSEHYFSFFNTVGHWLFRLVFVWWALGWKFT